jgi:putative salt-induced outer membrane protein YdiY
MIEQSTPLRLSGQISGLQFLGAVIIWLLASSCGHADKVVLTNGDIIEGVVTKQGRSSIVLEHSDLGSVEIPRSRIRSLAIEPPNVQVVLTDGDAIHGRLIDENESTIVLEHPNLGRLEIPREQIDSFKAKEHEFEKAERVAWFDPKMKKLAARTSRLREKGWESSLDISLDSSSGNTEEQSTRFGGHLQRNLPDRITTGDLSYYHKVKDSEISDNKLTLGLGRDWLLPESPWFYFLQGRFDYDEFESWQQRANAQVGPGYHLIQKDDMTLDVRSGLGVRREWGSINNNPKLEGLIGADFEWKITSKQICKFAPYYYPVLSDFGDYRTRFSGEWRYFFDEDMRLSFLVGSLYEFQSIVDPGKKHADLRVYLGLGYGF